MIVLVSRDRFSHHLTPHHGDCEGSWLSPGALEYLRRHTDYEPFRMERVSDYLVQRMRALGHLRAMAQAPPLGAFTQPFDPREAPPHSPVAQARAASSQPPGQLNCA
jgi:hypothetical protein